MELSRETGSLMNSIMGSAKQVAPVVGMGATILKWTDRTAGTIIEVAEDGNSFVMQADTATRSDSNGMSDSQSYTYEANPNGVTSRFAKVKRGRQTGQFRENGRSGANSVLIGHRDQYHDFSF